MEELVPLQKGQPPDPHIQELLRRTKELLDIQHASLEAAALAQESQEQLAVAAAHAAATQATIGNRVQQVLRTSLEILGVTTRTQRLVGALRRGAWRRAMEALLFDEWMVLWLYLLVHPFFPEPLEAAAAAWQFVLFAQRVWWLPADLRAGPWSPWAYFTSPWKALILLHWVNRQCMAAGPAAACAGGPAWTFSAPPTPPFQLCWVNQTTTPLQLNCVAETGVQAAADWGQALAASVAVPGFYAELRILVDFEEQAAHHLLRVVWRAVKALFWRTGAAAKAAGCELEVDLGRWLGSVRPFSFLCSS